MLWTVVLEKTLESPLDFREIKPVHPKENQFWIFFGRTDAETPILWRPDAKNWLTGKDPDIGKDWRQDEKEMTEDEMVGWHLWLDGQVWASSGSWWWTGKPGMLQFMGSQSWIRLSDWTKLNWTDPSIKWKIQKIISILLMQCQTTYIFVTINLDDNILEFSSEYFKLYIWIYAYCIQPLMCTYM